MDRIKIFVTCLFLGVFIFSFGKGLGLERSNEYQDQTQTQVNNDSSNDQVSQGDSSQESEEEGPTFHQILKTKFIEGGSGFMGIVLLALILGLAVSIERIIYLNMASINTKKFILKVEEAISKKDIEGAKNICRNTRGPVASIFYQGLSRVDEGIDIVEKSVVSYGSVQLGVLERNISWISLFIAIAPMLGFMGTVIGMISAFDSIEAAGEISATLVAKGIKQALLTTVFGLIVAIILQIFYNYIISKIDLITNSMEDSSILLLDMLVKNKSTK